MHLRVHRNGLAVALRAYVVAVVVGPVMVVSSRDDLAAFHEGRSKTVIHRRLEPGLEDDSEVDMCAYLGCSLEALRKIMLGLVHGCDCSIKTTTLVLTRSQETSRDHSTDINSSRIRTIDTKNVPIPYPNLRQKTSRNQELFRYQDPISQPRQVRVRHDDLGDIFHVEPLFDRHADMFRLAF